MLRPWRPLALLGTVALIGCWPSPRGAGAPPAAIELRWDRSAEPPLVVNDPPDSIRVRWTPSASADIDIMDIVDQHCRAWNRRVETVSEQASGDTRFAEFVCKG